MTCGFSVIACVLVSRDDAEVRFRYPDGQR